MDRSRRRLLLSAASLSALKLAGCASPGPAPPEGLAGDPFTLGVASGEPLADGFVIWTRLVPRPVADETGAGGMPPRAAEVRWLVAEDERLAKVAQTGIAIADPQWGHSIHVEVQGLKADRQYWYAFQVGDWRSPTGRARTAPLSGAPTSSFRFAFASCQDYEAGHYAAWRDVVASDPDLVIFLGDYTYERSAKDPNDRVRSNASPDPRTLAEYRRRYEQYRSDPSLQAAHAQCCWLMTWDDHDVQNDYANLENISDDPPDVFAARRAAAYQVWWEHMPLRLRARPVNGACQLYASFDFGDLVRFNVLDSRQYRDPHPCSAPGKRGGQLVDCPERTLSGRTLLGVAQEEWLTGRLSSSPAGWNVIAQQLLMATLDQKPGPGEAWWSDGWDGAPAARHRLLRTLQDRNVGNAVVIGGDIHSFWASDLRVNGPGSPLVATEFTGTSISSRGVPYDTFKAVLPDNPHVRYFESRSRGYVLCDVTKNVWKTQFRGVDDVRVADSPARTLASFAVESGVAGVQPG